MYFLPEAKKIEFADGWLAVTDNSVLYLNDNLLLLKLPRECL